MLERIRRMHAPERTLLRVLLILSFLLHGLWGISFATYLRDRADRREDLNRLSCAISDDARGSIVALHARQGSGLPGDDLLARNKTRLELAALAVTPHCPQPNGDTP